MFVPKMGSSCPKWAAGGETESGGGMESGGETESGGEPESGGLKQVVVS